MRSDQALSNSERRRYARHIRLPGFGIDAQENLRASSALVVGAGGLGAPALQYLAAAGVGRIGIIDFDTVEISNLQRQVLFAEADIGRSKAEAAAARLSAANSAIEVEAYPTELGPANAEELIGRFDVVLDGSDNFATRYLVNDASVRTGRPLIYGSVYRYEGQLAVLNLPGGPSYRCLYPDPPAVGETPSCSEAGVLAQVAGLVGIRMTWEAVRLLSHLGRGDDATTATAGGTGTLRIFDLRGDTEISLQITRRDEQIDRARRGPLGESERYNPVWSDGETASNQRPTPELTPAEVRSHIAAGAATLVDIREAGEREFGPDLGGLRIPGSMIRDRIDLLPEDGTIILYCDSGGRSRNLASWFRADRGWHRVYSLSGGSMSWESRE